MKDKQNEIKQNVWVIGLHERKVKNCDNQMQHVTLDGILDFKKSNKGHLGDNWGNCNGSCVLERQQQC